MEMGRKEIGGREWGEEKGKMRGEEESWGKGERRRKEIGEVKERVGSGGKWGGEEGENESREGE